jgi:hypothetical protein
MRIYIELLRDREAVHGLLSEHGWRLDKADGGYAAKHPAVRDERTARGALHALGLLTSAAVRIEFGTAARRPGTRGTVS